MSQELQGYNGIYCSFIKDLKREHYTEYTQIFVGKSLPLPEANDIDDSQVVAKVTNVNDRQNQFAISVTKNSNLCSFFEK